MQIVIYGSLIKLREVCMFSKVYIAQDIKRKDSDKCRVIQTDNEIFGASVSSGDTLGTSAMIGNVSRECSSVEVCH